jgi:disulfide bond formation protein DsbB
MAKRTLRFTGENSNRANTAFTIGVLTILAALCFEYIGGYKPCELCLGQRIPYYVGLPLLAILLIQWKRLPVIAIRIPATLLIAAIFIWGTYLGAFHAGVEWGFWPGPTACTSTVTSGLDFNSLNNLNDTKVVPCDVVQWRFLGLSFAGHNAVLSAIISGFLIWSAMGQIGRERDNKNKA